jgi:hypothetical protein
MWLPRVMRHTSHLNAVSFHTLRSLSSSTLITASRILSRYSHSTSRSLIFISGSTSRMKFMFLLCHNPHWEPQDRICVALMSFEEDTLGRVWDEIAFRWEVCRVTHTSHIEHQWTKSWMLGHCCVTISFQCVAWIQIYKPLILCFNVSFCIITIPHVGRRTLSSLSSKKGTGVRFGAPAGHEIVNQGVSRAERLTGQQLARRSGEGWRRWVAPGWVLPPSVVTKKVWFYFREKTLYSHYLKYHTLFNETLLQFTKEWLRCIVQFNVAGATTRQLNTLLTACPISYDFEVRAPEFLRNYKKNGDWPRTVHNPKLHHPHHHL